MELATSRILQGKCGGGWGFVARNDTGEFLEAGAGNLEHAASALQGKLWR